MRICAIAAATMSFVVCVGPVCSQASEVGSSAARAWRKPTFATGETALAPPSQSGSWSTTSQAVGQAPQHVEASEPSQTVAPGDASTWEASVTTADAAAEEPPAPNFLNPTTMVLAAAAAGGTVAVIASASGSNSAKPASP